MANQKLDPLPAAKKQFHVLYLHGLLVIIPSGPLPAAVCPYQLHHVVISANCSGTQPSGSYWRLIGMV